MDITERSYMLITPGSQRVKGATQLFVHLLKFSLDCAPSREHFGHHVEASSSHYGGTGKNHSLEIIVYQLSS